MRITTLPLLCQLITNKWYQYIHLHKIGEDKRNAPTESQLAIEITSIKFKLDNKDSRLLCK